MINVLINFCDTIALMARQQPSITDIPGMGKQQMQGIVVTKSDRTIRIRVVKHRQAGIYPKKITRHESYIVHDPANLAQIGDAVLVVECRPVSKLKRFALKQILSVH